jgi:uncharacterized membrane protein
LWLPLIYLYIYIYIPNAMFLVAVCLVLKVASQGLLVNICMEHAVRAAAVCEAV